MDDLEYLDDDIANKGTPSGALARLATRQQGVVSRGQLLRLGLSPQQIHTLVVNRRLHPLHRGVYAVGHTKLVPDAHLLAALLACGPTSFLSHRTAAAVWGLRPLALRQLEMTIPGPKAKRRPGITVHRTRAVPHRHEVRTKAGLRVSSVARLLVELASRETEQELERLLVAANRSNLLQIDRLQAALERHRRRPGIGKLVRVSAAYRPRPDRKSELERAFDRLLALNPDIPEPERNVAFDKWELDCYWPAHGVALELDGRAYHDALANMESDRLKDAKLLAAGVRPMRVTDRRFAADPQGALDDLRSILGMRRAA